MFKRIYINVKVFMFIAWYPSDFTIYTPGTGTLSYAVLASAHFVAAIANQYNLAFLFHQIPITDGWPEGSMIWYVCLTPAHGQQHDLNTGQWLVVTQLSTNRA